MVPGIGACARPSVITVEYNEECARPFESQVTHLFVGDQSDFSLLKRIGETASLFDVIVDDGGHTRKQQINSFIGLWPFVRYVKRNLKNLKLYHNPSASDLYLRPESKPRLKNKDIFCLHLNSK